MKTYIAALVGCFFIAPAFAEKGDAGVGVEGGMGFASTENYARRLGQALADATGRTVSYTYEESTLAFRLYGFYSLTDEIDLEVGYFRTGSLDINYAYSGSSVTTSVGFEADGFDYGVRFRPNESLFLKLGMHSLDLSQTVNVTISGTAYTATTSASDTGAYFGAGYQFDDNWSVGYSLYSDVGGDNGGDVGFLYAGYKF